MSPLRRVASRLTILVALALAVGLSSRCAPSAQTRAGETRARRSPEARDSLARRQAEAAIDLLRRGHTDVVWPLFRQRRDPSVCTYLVHGLARHGVDPAVLASRLDVEPDASARRALILALGQYDGDALRMLVRRSLVQKLLGWYRTDPDAGVHAAIAWLVGANHEGGRARALDWRQGDAIRAADRELAGRPADGRSWQVDGEGRTMVVVAGPVDFDMGSPSYERGRVPASDSPDETLHRVRIPRSFAIASTEVTVAQFRRFLDANPDVKRRHAYADAPARMEQVMRQFSPDDDGPQIAATWYAAAMYCNWSSAQEGIPRSEWVYPERFDGIRSGMRLPDDYLRRTGYRLPTEAEWEYAARAASTTPRFFGISDSLLDRFAWYSKHPPKRKSDPVDPGDPQRTWPVGQLEPNDFGLFDVYGNVWEWTQDRVRPYPADGTTHEDREDDVLVVSDSAARARRGGGFPYEAAMMRSAERGTVTAYPYVRRDNVGFRVARTITPPPPPPRPAPNDDGRGAPWRRLGSRLGVAHAEPRRARGSGSAWWPFGSHTETQSTQSLCC